MKLVICFICSLLVLSGISAQSIKNLDEKYGFKNIKLDVPISSLNISMHKLPEKINGYESYFVDDNIYYKINESILKSCIIQALDEKVYRIALQLSGTENMRKLLAEFVNAYGKPTKSEDDNNSMTYIWQSNLITLTYYLDLNDGINTEGFILIYSKKMFDLEKKKAMQNSLNNL